MKKLVDEIANRVAGQLRQSGIPFERDVSTGGLRVDFIVRTPDKKKVAIDVKPWEKYEGFRNRAAHQAALYEKVLGIDKALIFVDALERSSIPEGVVNSDTLLPALLAMFPEPPPHPTPKKPKRKMAKKATVRRAPVSTRPARPRAKVQVFAAMPFDQRYDDVFFFAMSHAAQVNGAVCERVDTSDFSGDIVSEIQSMIRGSDAVIVDLSESNPNVLYEAGYAHALRVPTVHICSTPLSQLPFDVSHWNTLQYMQGQVHLLRDPLARRLEAAIRLSK